MRLTPLIVSADMLHGCFEHHWGITLAAVTFLAGRYLHIYRMNQFCCKHYSADHILRSIITHDCIMRTIITHDQMMRTIILHAQIMRTIIMIKS